MWVNGSGIFYSQQSLLESYLCMYIFTYFDKSFIEHHKTSNTGFVIEMIYKESTYKRMVQK